jgi:hypothetical protein
VGAARHREPPQEDLWRGLDEDQPQTGVLLSEIAEKIRKELDHPARADVEDDRQAVHPLVRAGEEQRHQIERNVVDARVADVLQAAAEHGLARPGEPGDHERSVERGFTHHPCPPP